MRRREVRAARLDAFAGKRTPMTLAEMAQLFAPANDPEATDSWAEWHEQQRKPHTDEIYARDAIAEANSGTALINRRDE